MRDNIFWQKELETIDRKQLTKLQLDSINSQINTAKKSILYKNKLSKINKISSLKELENLPFTSKKDLQDCFPYGALSVKLKEVVRLHSSSGTINVPTIAFYTKNDINDWANLLARSMYMVGARDTDICQCINGYGLFTGGLGCQLAGETLGMLTIPISTGNTKKQIFYMKNFKTTVVHILPSYALRLLNYIQENNIDIKNDFNLRIFFIGAESYSEQMRKKIEKFYNVKVYDLYGLSEIYGPGIATECEYQNGNHIWEDYVYPEIIDSKTLKVLPDGQEGELVLTTLKKQAMPLIRYRTRDITKIISEPCKCGRTHRRIAKVTARTDDMIIINGVNIFPMQIEKVLLTESTLIKNYRVEILRKNGLDKLNIKLEINNEYFNNKNYLLNLKEKISKNLKNELGINPIIDFVYTGSIKTNEGKEKKVIDLRTTQ